MSANRARQPTGKQVAASILLHGSKDAFEGGYMDLSRADAVEAMARAEGMSVRRFIEWLGSEIRTASYGVPNLLDSLMVSWAPRRDVMGGRDIVKMAVGRSRDELVDMVGGGGAGRRAAEGGESFDEQVDRFRAQRAAAIQAALDAFGASPAVMSRLRGRADRPTLLLLSPETVPEHGKLRVTYMGPDGPHGHDSGDTIEKLADDVARVYEDFRPVDEDFVMEWTSTPEFEDGARRVAFVQAANGITWEAQQVSRDAYDWAAALRHDVADMADIREATAILERGIADIKAGRRPWEPNTTSIVGAAERRARMDDGELALCEVDEQGVHFETGVPVRFRYIRGTTRSPDLGGRFGQDIEPGGRYMVHNEDPGDLAPGWETGIAEFRAPLVLALTLDEDIYGPNGWKARLSRAAGGKKGKRLSCFLRSQGYDGIVTCGEYTHAGRTTRDTREIVDLSVVAC